MPAMKPNPGCKMPEVKSPLDITALVAANKLKKELLQKSQKALAPVIAAIPTLPGSDTVAALAVQQYLKGLDAIQKVLAANKLSDAVNDAIKMVLNADKLTSSLGKIPCPLPDVVDKDADPLS